MSILEASQQEFTKVHGMTSRRRMRGRMQHHEVGSDGKALPCFQKRCQTSDVAHPSASPPCDTMYGGGGNYSMKVLSALKLLLHV